MSAAEVETNPGECALTAASHSAAVAAESGDQNKPVDPKEQDTPAQRNTETPEQSEEAKTQKKSNENDKENEQNGGDTSESVKRKVVEAPPPKVNPWTKRTTGRVPINNITSGSSSQEKGNTLIVEHITKLRLCVMLTGHVFGASFAALFWENRL